METGTVVTVLVTLAVAFLGIILTMLGVLRNAVDKKVDKENCTKDMEIARGDTHTLAEDIKNILRRAKRDD